MGKYVLNNKTATAKEMQWNCWGSFFKKKKEKKDKTLFLFPHHTTALDLVLLPLVLLSSGE